MSSDNSLNYDEIIISYQYFPFLNYYFLLLDGIDFKKSECLFLNYILQESALESSNNLISTKQTH